MQQDDVRDDEELFKSVFIVMFIGNLGNHKWSILFF